MHSSHNEGFRHGSARFATEQEIAAAGMFQPTPNAPLIGFIGRHPIHYKEDSGGFIVAGARAGKLSTVLGYWLCSGIMSDINMVVLDLKHELAPISQDQTPDGKSVITWCPSGYEGLRQMRLNPLDPLKKDSPSLVSDATLIAENMIPVSLSGNSEFFQRRAQEFLLGIILTLVMINGEVTFAELHRAINLIVGDREKWLDFAYEMNSCGQTVSERVEAEIEAARGDSSGGFKGILGELFNAISCLNDPVLMASVSAPFDFSFAQLCEGNDLYQVYLMPDANFVKQWSPVIKTMFVAARIYKARKPASARIAFVIDEVAQLGRFPLILQLYSIGAGIGLIPFIVLQNMNQMDGLGDQGQAIITASSGLQIYFGIREISSARTISQMIGSETLYYDDPMEQGQADMAAFEMQQAILRGEDPFITGARLRQLMAARVHRSQMRRDLMMPDEVIRLPNDKAIIFADGVSYPILADRRPYWTQRFMAGRYHPNPYHPPIDRVRVKARIGYRWKRVITEPVPPAFSHLPQYADGTWSRIER